MSEKKAKGKSAKTRKGGGEKSVLGSLPSTRPARMGRPRDGAPAATTAAAKPKAVPAAAKPEAVPTAKAKAATTARPKAAKPRPTAAQPAAAAVRKPAVAAAKPRAADGPRAVRSGSPSLPRPAPARAPQRQRSSGPPKGAELVATAVQAAGELAQIGVSLSARMVKRAVDRLPKP